MVHIPTLVSRLPQIHLSRGGRKWSVQVERLQAQLQSIQSEVKTDQSCPNCSQMNRKAEIQDWPRPEGTNWFQRGFLRKAHVLDKDAGPSVKCTLTHLAPQKSYEIPMTHFGRLHSRTKQGCPTSHAMCWGGGVNSQGQPTRWQRFQVSLCWGALTSQSNNLGSRRLFHWTASCGPAETVVGAASDTFREISRLLPSVKYLQQSKDRSAIWHGQRKRVDIQLSSQKNFWLCFFSLVSNPKNMLCEKNGNIRPLIAQQNGFKS